MLGCTPGVSWRGLVLSLPSCCFGPLDTLCITPLPCRPFMPHPPVPWPSTTPQPDGDAFATSVKEALVYTLATNPAVTDREATEAAAVALRRRIDVVLPAGSLPPPASDVLLGDVPAAQTDEELNAPIDLDAMLAEDPELMAKFLEGLEESSADDAASESVDDDDFYDDAEEDGAPEAVAEDPSAWLGTEGLDLPRVDL